MRPGGGENSQFAFWVHHDRDRFEGTWRPGTLPEPCGETCANHPRNRFHTTFFRATEDALRTTQTGVFQVPSFELYPFWTTAVPSAGKSKKNFFWMLWHDVCEKASDQIARDTNEALRVPTHALGILSLRQYGGSNHLKEQNICIASPLPSPNNFNPPFRFHRHGKSRALSQPSLLSGSPRRPARIIRWDRLLATRPLCMYTRSPSQ